MPEGTVLCVGHVNWDVVLHTEVVPDPDHSTEIQESHTSTGGSATNTSLVLSNLGEDVVMAGSVGEDEYGESVLEVFKNNGVKPCIKQTNEGATTVIRAIITDNSDPRYFAKNQAVDPFSTEVVDIWDEISHMHITSFDEDISKDFVKTAVENNITISFNPSQGYSEREFPHIVESADVIFLNKREAEIFRQRYNFGEKVENGTTIVITHGAAGCTAYAPDGVVTHSGFSNETVIDTVGAGDSFVAGFLTEWSKNASKDEIKYALGKASACGADSVDSVGAPASVTPERFLETVKE